MSEFFNSEEKYKEITVTVSPPKVKGSVDFIKIDVEGAEYNVLKACEKYAKHDPLIHIEIHNDTYGKPSIQLKGAADSYLRKKIKNKKYIIHLSLSDDKPWAQATVIISYN